MGKQLVTSYINRPENNDGQTKLIEILSHGIFVYLKKEGLLKDAQDRSEKIKMVLEKARVAGDQAEEYEDEPEEIT